MSNIVLNILSKKKNLSYPLVFSKIGSYYWNKKHIKFELDKGDNKELLYWACQKGYTQVVEYIIDKGVIDIDYEKLSIIASKRGYVDIIKVIFKNVSFNGFFANVNGNTCLVRATANGHLNLIKYLIEKGADINYIPHNYKFGALCHAAHYGYLEIVKYLVEKGADIFVNGKQPIREAYENKHFEVVEYLRLKALEQKNKSKCIIM